MRSGIGGWVKRSHVRTGGGRKVREVRVGESAEQLHGSGGVLRQPECGLVRLPFVSPRDGVLCRKRDECEDRGEEETSGKARGRRSPRRPPTSTGRSGRQPPEGHEAGEQAQGGQKDALEDVVMGPVTELVSHHEGRCVVVPSREGCRRGRAAWRRRCRRRKRSRLWSCGSRPQLGLLSRGHLPRPRVP